VYLKTQVKKCDVKTLKVKKVCFTKARFKKVYLKTQVKKYDVKTLKVKKVCFTKA
jgi:hypothetical protein